MPFVLVFIFNFIKVSLEACLKNSFQLEAFSHMVASSNLESVLSVMELSPLDIQIYFHLQSFSFESFISYACAYLSYIINMLDIY